MSKYSEKFKDPRWQKKRLQIMNRDKFTCKLCGDTETTLNVHHKEYISGNDPWDYPNKMLVTLCEHCHTEISRPEHKGIEYSKFSIIKPSDLHLLIMFVSRDGLFYVSIYDLDNNHLSSFGFNARFDVLIKMLQKTIRDGKKIH